MIKIILYCAAYIVLIFVFHFIANIVCRLIDCDTELNMVLSVVWPLTLICVVFRLIFFMLECASDNVYWKIEGLIQKKEKRKREQKGE